MKKILLTLICIIALFAVIGCGSVSNAASTEAAASTVSQDTGANIASGSTKGCDLSWCTAMEASGYKFYNTSGTRQDIFLIMKNLGFGSVRLRVWTVSSGYNSQSDVVAKAKRAAAQGMSVYLTFHYSDTWADPGNQKVPSAWSSYTYSQMCTAVYNHTKTVVSAVRAVANVGWVSIGNETQNGMIWPTGNATNNPSQYAGLVTSGHNGAHDAGCGYAGVHLANMWDTSTWTWNFGILNSKGASYDFCGGSIYPTTSNYATKISQAKTTKSKMSKTCLVAEFGIASDAGKTGYTAWTSAQSIGDAFYWEPECYGGWQDMEWALSQVQEDQARY